MARLASRTAKVLPPLESFCLRADDWAAQSRPLGGARLDRILGEVLKGETQSHRVARSLASHPTGSPHGTVESRNDAGVSVEEIERWVAAEAQVAWKLGADSLTAVLNPNAHTELFLRLTREAEVLEASLCCERGDFVSLSRDWRVLRSSLARQSVRLLPLLAGPPHAPAALVSAAVSPS